MTFAITLVANASKEAADWFHTHLRIKRERNFKLLVRWRSFDAQKGSRCTTADVEQKAKPAKKRGR